MHKLTISQFVRALLAARTPTEVVELFDAGVKRAYDKQSLSVSYCQWQDRQRVRRPLADARRLVTHATGFDAMEEVAQKRLVRWLSQVAAKVPLSGGDLVNPVPEPWHAHPRNFKAVVVLGVREYDSVPTRSSRAQGPSYGIDPYDVEASLVVKHHLQHTGLDPDVELCQISANTTLAQAKSIFERMYSDPDVGAVIVIGCWVANMMAVAVTNEILAGKDATEIPYGFRYTIPPISEDKLARGGAWSQHETGVDLGHRPPLLRRDNEGAGAGILLVDARRRLGRQGDTPFLVAACMGIGGQGTVASTAALMRHEHVMEFLRESESSRTSPFVGEPIPGVCIVPIEVTTHLWHQGHPPAPRWRFAQDPYDGFDITTVGTAREFDEQRLSAQDDVFVDESGQEWFAFD